MRFRVTIIVSSTCQSRVSSTWSLSLSLSFVRPFWLTACMERILEVFLAVEIQWGCILVFQPSHGESSRRKSIAEVSRCSGFAEAPPPFLLDTFQASGTSGSPTRAPDHRTTRVDSKRPPYTHCPASAEPP